MSHVKDFGAVGDGLNDDTEAIRHAIANHDGRVDFSGGRFRVNGSIEIDLATVGPIALTGGGSGAIVMDGSGPALRVLGGHQGTADPRNVDEATWTKTRLPLIQDLEIGGLHDEADGIELNGCWQPSVVGVVLHDLRHGVVLAKRNRNLVIDRCHIYHNTGCGIFFREVNLHQANITGSHVSYNRQGGIRIQSSEVRNLQITGNDIEYNNAASHDSDRFDTSEPTAEIYFDCGKTGSLREITISSNTIQATASPHGANIRMIGTPEEDHRIGMLSISGNLIGSQETNIWLTRCRGITLSGNYIYGAENRNLLLEDCSNVVSSGNCIGSNPDYAVPVRQVGLQLKRCKSVSSTGDLIESMTSYDPQQVSDRFSPATALLEIEQCDSVMVGQGHWVNAHPAAVAVNESSRVSLFGCQMSDTRTVENRRMAVQWKGQGEHNAIQFCLLKPGDQGLIYAARRAQVEQASIRSG